MRVGFLQFRPEFARREENLARVESYLSKERDGLIVLPELFSTGYNFSSKKKFFSLSEEIPGRTTEFLGRIARKNNLYIVAGIAERDGERLFNSSCLISKSGIVMKYRKAHLFGREKLIFLPGAIPYEVCEIDGVKIGLLICFDWIFPEAMRSLALKGAQIICHSANLVLPYCQSAMVTRAIENRVFIITANRTGTEGDLKFTGKSQVVAPGGRILLKARRYEEVLIMTKINPEDAISKKVTSYNDLFKDRREELYFT
jgi:predicted amidohydrolase